MIIEVTAMTLSVMSAVLSFFSYKRSNKSAQVSEAHSIVAKTHADASAAPITRPGGHKICSKCGLTVARYESTSTGIKCFNCKGL